MTLKIILRKEKGAPKKVSKVLFLLKGGVGQETESRKEREREKGKKGD